MRKHTLVECNAKFAEFSSEPGSRWLIFDCPEGHEDCRHAIPFTPTIEGVEWQHSQAIWQRSGGATIETITLSPSIRRNPQYPSRDAAIAAGCMPEHVTPTLLCALHIFIRDGRIEFCGDSR